MALGSHWLASSMITTSNRVLRGSKVSATSVNGMIRYNTNTNQFEAYANGSWGSLVTTGSGSGSSALWTNGTGGQIFYNAGNVGIGTTTPNAPLSFGVNAGGAFPR